MKFLIDTNILIPLEPQTGEVVPTNTSSSLALAQKVTEGGHTLYVHPEIRTDINRDTNQARRDATKLVLPRYPELPSPPGVAAIERTLGETVRGTNDWVDNCLIAAVHADAIDYLVTEDGGVHRKARRLGLSDRILTIAAATDLLRDLYDRTPRPPPHVEHTKAHGFDLDDPIFESFRDEYPGFDAWIKKCRQQHRDAWFIRAATGGYAAVGLVKPEIDEGGFSGRVLKICSFKVAPEANGSKFGELLLRTVFDFAYENGYAQLYVTVFPSHAGLIALFRQFGFSRSGATTPLGEEILTKTLGGAPLADESPFAYHVRCGPRAVTSYSATPGYIVPIQPAYHDLLFPPREVQVSFDFGNSSKPFGNAIRKAYLCHAQVRKIAAGDNLFFYRSSDLRAVCSTGVVEATEVSRSPAEIAKLVGTRTVYRYDEIESMCRDGKVLALLFRHSRTLSAQLSFDELKSNGVVKGAPQSIMTVSDAGRDWFDSRLGSQG